MCAIAALMRLKVRLTNLRKLVDEAETTRVNAQRALAEEQKKLDLSGSATPVRTLPVPLFISLVCSKLNIYCHNRLMKMLSSEQVKKLRSFL